MQPEIRPRFYPEQHIADPVHAPDVKRTAERRLAEVFDRIDALLGEGPYLLGERYSGPDPYLLMLVMATRAMPRPARGLPNVTRHVEPLLARDAIRRTFEREGIAEPFV